MTLELATTILATGFGVSMIGMMIMFSHSRNAYYGLLKFFMYTFFASFAGLLFILTITTTRTTAINTTQEIKTKSNGRADYTATTYENYKDYNLKLANGKLKTVKHAKTAYSENQVIRPYLKTFKTQSQASLGGFVLKSNKIKYTYEVHLNANDR